MDMKQYTASPKRLLVEIGFAGAQYGLVQPTMSLAQHLGRDDNTRPASILILGLLNISMRNYDGARQILQSFCETKAYEKYHPQAENFLKVLNQISPAKK